MLSTFVLSISDDRPLFPLEGASQSECAHGQHHRARDPRRHPHRRLSRVCVPPPHRPLSIRHVRHALPGEPHDLGRRLLLSHQGYYTDSILKFRLIFPSNYPERPPTGQFLTDVFHPLISQQDGTYNFAPRFRPWKLNEHHGFDVLPWVKAAKKHALDDIREGDCFNKEASRLYHATTSSFAALTTSSTLSQSASTLCDKDDPSIVLDGQLTTRRQCVRDGRGRTRHQGLESVSGCRYS